MILKVDNYYDRYMIMDWCFFFFYLGLGILRFVRDDYLLEDFELR